MDRIAGRGVAEDFWTFGTGGAAQDLLALNIDMASVMQAERWKDMRMPMRYGKKVLRRCGPNV